MKDNDIKKIGDIVECFAIINDDINEVFKKMSELVEAKVGFNADAWRKKIKNANNPKEDYFDYDDFLNDTWYVKNYYGEYENLVYGFTFLIHIDNDQENNYERFIESLGVNLNKKAPLLCIYGAYKPVDLKEEILFTYEKDGYEYQWYNEIIGILDGWNEFEEKIINCNKVVSRVKNISKEKVIDVEIDCLNEDKKIFEGYKNWFKEAKVKIIPLTDINTSENIEEVVEDLFSIKM